MRRIGKIVVLFLVLAAVVSLGVASGTAGKSKKAKRTHVSSQVTLQALGPDGVIGRVAGAHGACRAQRHVTVYRVNSGPSVPSSEFVAATWTLGDGSWSIPGPLYLSEFFAVVDAKSAKRVVCSSATSNSQAWG